MKITGIELLNKMASGEEIPKKIKIYDDVYEYDKFFQDYISIEDDDKFQESYNIFEILNDEIEIIKEPKEDLVNIDLLDTPYTKNQNDFAVEKKINELIENQNKIVKELKNKENTKS